MSAEQAREEDIPLVEVSAHSDVAIGSLNPRLERRLMKRAQQIKDQIKRSEESQRCTAETMKLEFTF